MFCSECGSANSDKAKFCYQCGASIMFPAPQSVVPIPTENKSKDNSTRKFLYPILITLLVVIGAVGVFGVISLSIFYFENKRANERTAQNFNKANTQTFSTNQAAQTPIPYNPDTTKVQRAAQEAANAAAEAANRVAQEAQKQTPQKRIILNKTIPVNASSYSWIPFNLNRQSQIIGKVTAQGGSNDIETIILESDEFVNYQNTGRFRSFFKSGYVTISNIDLTLPKGNYYIIFNNSAALLTSKVITAKIEQIQVE